MPDDKRERVADVLRNELWARRKGKIDLLHEDANDMADAVLAALAEGTDESQPTAYALLEYALRGGLWYLGISRRGVIWSRGDAEAEARRLAQEGVRVRIVPLLRGTPVEIEGGSDG